MCISHSPLLLGVAKLRFYFGGVTGWLDEDRKKFCPYFDEPTLREYR
jgi:hypothetical protein